MVVALSGGADSAAAAWLASESEEHVMAVHVHHGSPHSDLLERAAGRIARRLDLELRVVRVHVPDGPSYEAQARTVRHAALAAVVGSDAWLVTGHTRDDQVETLLMRLARGTGIDGLAGMARSEAPFLRPLLDTTRSEAREIAAIVGLDWRDDPSNIDRRFLRNRVRHDLVPMLESVFGPAVATSLHRSADVIRRDIEALELLAGHVDRHDAERRVELSLRDLERVGEAIAARAIRNAIRSLNPPYAPPARVVETALDIAAGRTRRAEIGQIVISRSDRCLIVATHDA
jgi:tRNA(Ile)-lysidine synthase